ncbi:unnamed protein product [Rotaria socialis]|uniref:Uncharacterized protein n=1 Tax=Rotaria socialis TaxID=392032 RepID=A0A820V6F8_9BILA|nr:unnamed protein product [Rotaria socialis]
MYHSKFKRSSNQTVQLKISLAYLIENIQFYTFRFRLITSADLQCMTGNLCVHLIHTVRSKTLRLKVYTLIQSKISDLLLIRSSNRKCLTCNSNIELRQTG